MVRVLTIHGTFDYVKVSMLPHYISTGYIVAPASMLNLYTKKEVLVRKARKRLNP